MSLQENKNKVLVVITVLFLFNLSLYYFKPEILTQLELKTYDWRLSYGDRRAPSDTIIIGAIDDESLKQLGRWPWSRQVFGECIRKMSESGVKAIGIDVLFPETSGDDEYLAKSLKNNKTVLATSFIFDEMENKEDFSALLQGSAFQLVNNNEDDATPESFTALPPIEKFVKSVRSLGHINMFPHVDGVVREEFVGIKYGGLYVPSLAIQVYKVFYDIPDDEVFYTPGESLSLRDKQIALDTLSGFLIDYVGPENTFKRIPMSDFYLGKIPKGSLNGKIVLVGATALGIYDLRVTPTSSNMPGIEKHANVLENMINNRFIREIEWYYTIIFMFLFFLMYLITAKYFKFTGISLLGMLSFAAYAAVCFFMFKQYRLWINAIYPSLTNITIFISVLMYKYGVEERSGREMKKMFSSYVSEKIVDALVKNPEMAKLGGIRKQITVLFADARGFTTFSEKHTPEEVVMVLNDLLGEMTEIIMRNDGTLDKFVGDEIMAIWNAPVDQANHAELATNCSIEMIKRNRELVKEWAEKGEDPLTLGVGLNTGDAIAGNMGADGKKMDYTVIGDTVNLGARVEALTRPMDADILITEYTYEKVHEFLSKRDDIVVEECPPQKVKGKAEPVRIFKIIVK